MQVGPVIPWACLRRLDTSRPCVQGEPGAQQQAGEQGKTGRQQHLAARVEQGCAAVGTGDGRQLVEV